MMNVQTEMRLLRQRVKNADWIIEKYRSELIEKQTLAEKILAEKLTKRKIDYIPQYPIKSELMFFFADFYIPTVKLAIEVDGKYHDNKKGADRLRDILFSDLGIVTFRYTNEEILESKKAVIAISREIKLAVKIMSQMNKHHRFRICRKNVKTYKPKKLQRIKS